MVNKAFAINGMHNDNSSDKMLLANIEINVTLVQLMWGELLSSAMAYFSEIVRDVWLAFFSWQQPQRNPFRKHEI